MTGDNADALKILAAEPLPQNGKRAVLFLDGHVERIDEVDYQQWNWGQTFIFQLW